MMLHDNDILIADGTDYLQMTICLLEEADLASRIGSRKSRIALKPNLVSPSPASFGATTHTEIVEGIIRYLQGHGFEDIRIMESSWVGARTSDAIKTCGYDRLCEKYSIPFLDMQKEKAVARDCAGMELNICRAVEDVDFLINIPVLKGHCQTRMTCCLKNLKGLIPSREKRRFHSLGLHKPIAHLAAGIRQDFIVVDNICGDPDFEDGGNPFVVNRILAGVDPVLLDTYACRTLDLSPDQVGYLTLAARLGVGSMDLDHANLRRIGTVRENMSAPGDPELQGAATDLSDCGALSGTEKDVPHLHKIVDLYDAVEEVESCSACYGYLIPALDRLRSDVLKDGGVWDLPAALGSRICIGQGWKGRSGRIGVGHCTCLFESYVDGCPPTPDQIYAFLKELLNDSPSV